MCQQQAVELLPDQVGLLAVQNDAVTSQVSLEFVERGLDFPALVVQGGELPGRRALGFQHTSQQAVQRLSTLHPSRVVFHHPHRDAPSALPPLPLRCTHRAHVRPVAHASLAWKTLVLRESAYKIGTCEASNTPHVVSKEFPISQAEHALLNLLHHLPRQGQLALAVRAESGSEQHVRAPSTSDTKRTFGYTLRPRLATGRRPPRWPPRGPHPGCCHRCSLSAIVGIMLRACAASPPVPQARRARLTLAGNPAATAPVRCPRPRPRGFGCPGRPSTSGPPADTATPVAPTTACTAPERRQSTSSHGLAKRAVARWLSRWPPTPLESSLEETSIWLYPLKIQSGNVKSIMEDHH